ncbi:MAG: alpha/beta hydrolase-fold protein, partial [Armatimonadota bacterium]
ANDWWLNPETYGNPVAGDPATGQKPPTPHEGFVIKAGATKLNPDSGLHVHTVAAGEPTRAYYAVTTTDAAGVENLEVVAGANSLAQPLSQQVAPVQPVWQEAGTPNLAAGKGLPLHFILHAKTGRGGMQYLAFGEQSLGWREGLPFKFGVRVTKDAVEVSPTDRTWIGRMFPEGLDGCQTLTPAIHSFWYGYNDHIYDPALMAQGTVVNFTERRLLWILDWVKRTYQTDPNRTYAFGSSMGGCGDLDVCLRHPEIFAAIRAHVPIVAYGKGPGGDSEMRVVKETGGMDKLTNEGMTVRDRLDGTKFVREFKGDLPFLVITNGRQDMSIPWWKNPDFYRAMREARQGMLAAWDEGTHSTCGAAMPADVTGFNNLSAYHKLFALNQSYLALSNSSQDNNPGNGDAKDGDPVGFMGRGFTWEPPVDEAGKYEVLVKWGLEADKLPVTVDVTPRRVQRFKVKPSQKVTAVNVDAEGKEIQRAELVADESGLVTWKGFRVTGAGGNWMRLR